MELRTMKAKEGYIFAYKDGEEEIRMSNILYLGVNDDGKRYYEVEEKVNENVEK